MDKYFASDYAEARGKFLAAAESADVPLWQFDHPLKGPMTRRSARVIWLGAQDARHVVVVGSATRH